MSSTAQGFGEQRLPAGAPAALPEPAPLSVGAEPASLAPPFVLGEPPLPFGAPPGPSSTQAPDAQRPSHASRFTVTRSGPQTTSSLSSQKAPPGQSRSQPGAIVAQFARVESQSSPRTQVSATTQTPPLHSRMLDSAAAAHRRLPSSEQGSPESPPASPPLPIAASPPLPLGAAPAAPASPLFGLVAKFRPPAPNYWNRRLTTASSCRSWFRGSWLLRSSGARCQPARRWRDPGTEFEIGCGGT